MIAYIKMKRNEMKVKAMLYETIVGIMDNQKEIAGLLQRLFVALKDVPTDELRIEFIEKLAEVVHDENKENN